MKEKEVVIYPNNTACVDGQLLTQDESTELLKKHGIHDIRLAGDLKFTRGDTMFTIFTAPTLKMLDELSVSIEELRSVGRKHENAIKSIQKKLPIIQKELPTIQKKLTIIQKKLKIKSTKKQEPDKGEQK